MKHNNIIRLAAFGCAMTAMFSVSSCTEEDPIALDRNYQLMVSDSTYFTYDVAPFEDELQDKYTLNIYTYKVTTKSESNLKLVKYNSRTKKFTLTLNSSAETTTDKMKAPSADDLSSEYKFFYGAGTFKSAAIVGTNDALDIEAILPSFNYPSVDTLRNLPVAYKLYDITSSNVKRANGVTEIPSWATDAVSYENADGSVPQFVRGITNPVSGGTSLDDLKVGEGKAISFDKINFSHDIDFNLSITKDDALTDFVISNIYCIYAGVPTNVKFSTGFVDVENTAKYAFVLENVSDDANNKTVTGSRTISTLGLTYGKDSVATSGTNVPGTMQLCIEGRKGSQTVHLTALCNVSKSVKNAQLFTKSKSGWKWNSDNDVDGQNKKVNVVISTKITAAMITKALNGEVITLKD